jgi:hypothetical protein
MNKDRLIQIWTEYNQTAVYWWNLSQTDSDPRRRQYDTEAYLEFAHKRDAINSLIMELEMRDITDEQVIDYEARREELMDNKEF